MKWYFEWQSEEIKQLIELEILLLARMLVLPFPWLNTYCYQHGILIPFQFMVDSVMQLWNPHIFVVQGLVTSPEDETLSEFQTD